jgi:Peptidase family M23
MNYKTLLLLTGLLCQTFFGLLLQRPSVAAACEANIAPGDYVREKSWVTCKRYRFIFQSDGNLVLYSPSGIPLSNPVGAPLWATGTNGPRADKLRLSVQSDGNVVLYEENRPIWASDTSGNLGSRLVLQDDGNLVVYKPNGQPIFNTGTNGGRQSTLSASSTWLAKRSGETSMLPFAKGTTTKIEQGNSGWQGSSHSPNWTPNPKLVSPGFNTYAVDFGLPMNSEVRAVRKGVVVYAAYNGDFGNVAVVKYSDNKYGHYLHLNSFSVKNNQEISGGALIGKSGSTGNTTGPHLHYHESLKIWGVSVKLPSFYEGADLLTTGKFVTSQNEDGRK